jgi:hypothetical protein
MLLRFENMEALNLDLIMACSQNVRDYVNVLVSLTL